MPPRRPALDLISHSPEQTRRIGMHLGRLVQPGDLVLLAGPIGGGKTALVQGIARGLRVDGYVQSPTFTLAWEHAARTADGRPVRLYHLDLYRLDDPAELETFGLDEYLDAPDGVTVIEWPERLTPEAFGRFLLIELEHIADTKRRLVFCPHGERYEKLVEDLRREVFGAGRRGRASGD